MCIYIGTAFTCYNAVLSQESREPEGVGNCRQIYKHLQTTYRQNDPRIHGSLLPNFFHLPCNPRCELPDWEISPREIIYGYCDICVPRDEDGDVDPQVFRGVGSLYYRNTFFQEFIRHDWGCLILTQEESEADGWRGWRRIAVEESLRPYVHDWLDARGIPRNPSNRPVVHNEDEDHDERNEHNEDVQSHESDDSHRDNDRGHEDEGSGQDDDDDESDEGTMSMTCSKPIRSTRGTRAMNDTPPTLLSLVQGSCKRYLVYEQASQDTLGHRSMGSTESGPSTCGSVFLVDA